MKGLSDKEAAERLGRYGYNELPSAGSKNLRQIAAESIREPMFLLLIACAVLYMLLGDYREGMIMLSSTLLIISITFYQYRKTERALEALKNLSSPRALVIREGVEKRIPGREVVPGDIMIVSEGDRIAADADLLESVSLSTDESLLTGESFPVTKSPEKEASGNNARIYSGSMVVQGRGKAEVKATGIHTEFGKIGLQLKSIEDKTTRLQTEMKTLIRNLFLAGILISIGVVAAFYVTRGHFINALLSGLAASMAILPEEFPVVLTVFLALGAWRLSSRNVLTRKPSAIETLGSATVLCSDKTGTITLNRMQVAAVYDGTRCIYRNEFDKKDNSAEAVLGAAHKASFLDSHDPMDRAITEVFVGIHGHDHSAGDVIREYPLSRELPLMTRVLRSGEAGKLSVYSKGAPETLFGMCRPGKETEEHYRKQLTTLAGQGYRVLAVAVSEWSGEYLPENQDGFSLSLCGLLALEDPVRPEVPGAISECRDAGIRVMMITGDYPLTAESIAVQAGIEKGAGIMTGKELDALSDEELRKRIGSISIFARAVPEQKLRIVRALQASGEVVAMTGDGVNDAPALRAADIGIAMGNKGTDVAREASSLVLLDDNFASIVAAIRSGRKIYDNLQKAMSYIMAVHIPIIGLALLPAFFPDMPLILLPLHIIFMELIIDPVSSVAFESEQEEKNIMKRPPRSTTLSFFGRRQITGSVLRGGMLLLMVLCVYYITLKDGHSEGEVRAISFTALILGNLFLVLSSLSVSRSIFGVLRERNLPLILISSTALLLLLLIQSIPSLRSVFGFEYPGHFHFAEALMFSAGMMLVLELIKFLRLKKINPDK